ncbi:MAG: Nif3-like dinuclear metal center hexameric protein [Erysipelotrichaceae bacterium]|nr:Nif3-like dinuclear metal center hexameric protein [Erysipelotrichaceae bacterium]MBQ6216068.1 Nif3-like dinuclear metal center hexameric protein [Erysipelotrichaceae bacterium]MBR3006253.1 Nif3-like dinuclear metal center hexameric protein [Erysipelotrichaceae bacterium]
MLISEVIQSVKDCCKGSWLGRKIEDATTRDKVLYGSTDKECTGIVTTIYASPDVIRKAHELGANLIIAHEALFWNHGDHQDWLKESENKTYLAKAKLMDDYGITVWRFHDYIHSGIPYEGGYIDGIFYGLVKETGWDKAIVNNADISSAVYMECQETTPRKIGELIKEKWHLNGIKCIGDLDCKVTKVMICGHVSEGGDSNSLIKRIDREDINLMIPLELIDFTLTEYVKDSAQLGFNRAILAPGHFNVEEPGMKYMEEWLPGQLKEKIAVTYVQAGDMYEFL